MCTWCYHVSTLLLLLITTMTATYQSTEKLSAFECGFHSFDYRTPFSVRFSLLAVVFLVFDAEVALLMPLFLSSMAGMNFQMIAGGVFFLILWAGLIYEWFQGSLSWVI
uniref:NADH-ubiquinone oxidoreductase chain 3 n=1 Tax=Flustrellidra hispida TaxID=97271 RepID=Q15K46_9BILA|nr:NADH dehydrogenase subunit 3 [Flustrellidra hispida]AAZ76752.1 NADH dehydrogenase subunit 3 [Flustrellidra hispida]